MPVVGVLVEAVVGHEHELVADLVAQVAQRDLHDAVGGVGARPGRVLRRRERRRGSPRGRRGRRASALPCAGSPACAARRPASRRPAPARRCLPSRTAARRGRRPRRVPRRRDGATPGCGGVAASAARERSRSLTRRPSTCCWSSDAGRCSNRRSCVASPSPSTRCSIADQRDRRAEMRRRGRRWCAGRPRRRPGGRGRARSPT